MIEGADGKSVMDSEIPGLGGTANCAFGVGSDVNMCKWSNLNMSAFHWMSSSGVDSYWLGGPQTDDNEKNKQGTFLRNNRNSYSMSYWDKFVIINDL